MFIIDFAHESGGNLHHGTISMIDGTVRATWTVDENGLRKSRDIAVTEDSFRRAWDGLNEIPEFRNGAVTDPDAPMDFVTHHIIAIMFRLSGQEGMRTFAIPSASTSAEFSKWLSLIGYSGK
jgi:hypothetical protein